MASIQIDTILKMLPTIPPSEVPRAYALLRGYTTILQYRSTPTAEFDNFACCRSDDEIHDCTGSPYCHAAEIVFDARPDFAATEHVESVESPSLDADQACRHAADIRVLWDKPENMEKAEGLFREIVDKYPSLANGHFGLGELLIVKADREQTQPPAMVAEGLSHLHEATRLDPWHHEATLKLSSKLCPVNFQWAEALCQLALRAAGKDRDLLYPPEWQAGDYWQVAIAAAENGAQEFSVEMFCRAIGLDGKFSGYYMPSSQQANSCWQKALRSLGKTEWFDKQDKHQQRVWNVLHGGSMLDDPLVIACPSDTCHQRLRIPNTGGKLRVTCPKCKTVFTYNEEERA